MLPEFFVVLTAMTPTLEAHGALTLALGVFKFSLLKSFLLTATGTISIVAPLLFFWKRIVQTLMSHLYLANRFFSWLFSYTRARHADKFETIDPAERRAHFLKAFALYVFVAIPGPLTGVWAASVAAYLFGVPFRYAFWSIVLGALSVAALDALIIAGVVRLAMIF